MRQKIYISGKITGIEEEAQILFADAARKLTALGYDVANPMELPHDHDKEWESYMRVCIRALMDCEVVFFLKNWEDSKGAVFELFVADMLGLKLMYQK